MLIEGRKSTVEMAVPFCFSICISHVSWSFKDSGNAVKDFLLDKLVRNADRYPDIHIYFNIKNFLSKG